MTPRRLAAALALALGGLAANARAGPLSLELPPAEARGALAIELGADGLWLKGCAAAPCAARSGRRLELPPAALAAVARGRLDAVELAPNEPGAHLHIPLGADSAYEALIAAGAGASPPVVAFAGVTGLVSGEDGQREGDAVWVRDDAKGRRILVGREREDVQLCGRP